MDVFANFVLSHLSDFRLEENSVNCLSKKPGKIYLSTFSFCTSILHQFGQCNLIRTAFFF